MKEDQELSICKAGCTLEDFAACRKWFFVQKSSIVWCHYDYLSAPDRDGASPNSNRKYQTCLIFTTLGSGCLWRDTSDSQWEQASVIYRMLRASIAETWQPQTCRESREHHPYSFVYFVFHCETERTPGEPADNVDCPLFVFLLLSRLISRVSVRSRVTVKSFLQSSSVRSRGLLESSSVRVQMIRLKIFMSVVSHGFKIG